MKNQKNEIIKKKNPTSRGLHHKITNRKLILFTQIEMIKPQQLSRYLVLQRPGQ